MSERPSAVSTPEKAMAYVNKLMREARFLERVLSELPTYFDALPNEAQAEIETRISRLQVQIREFRVALHKSEDEAKGNFS